MNKIKIPALICGLAAIALISAFILPRSHGALADSANPASSHPESKATSAASSPMDTRPVKARPRPEHYTEAAEGYSTDFSDSLRGHVSNKYNLRDDILKYIDERYKDPSLRAWLIRYAVAQQDFIERGSTREAAIYQADQISKANACLYQKLGRDRYEEKGAILAMALNTEARFRAYWKAVDLQSNRATILPEGDPCEQ